MENKQDKKNETAQNVQKTQSEKPELTRQELIDLENPSAKEWAAIQFLTRMNKTQINNAWRSLNMMSAAAPKTIAKKLSFEETMEAMAIAMKYME